MKNEYRNVMFISPNSIKANGLINYNVDDTTIGYAIRNAQNIYLIEIIGSRLFSRLKQLIYNAIASLPDNIDEPENAEYAILLDEFIEPYLIARVTVDSLIPLSYKMRNIGVSKDSDTNIAQASIEELKYLINWNNTQVAEYATRLSKYLCENKDVFEELDDKCGCGGNYPILGHKYANVPLYLGNNNDKCCGK